MRFFFVLALGCWFFPFSAKADFLAERRILWEGVLSNWAWDMCEASAAKPQSRTAQLLALHEKSFDSFFADLASGRFDGEDSEWLAITLCYVDCKLGHQVLMKQLNRQSPRIRSYVAKELLGFIGYGSQKVPGYFLAYLERNRQLASH